MARWRIAVACALAIATMPGAAAAYTLDEFASVFRQPCLDQMPDLAGSEAEFRRLGFGGEWMLQRSNGSNGWMMAMVDLGTFGAFVCSLSGELAGDGPTPEFLQFLVGAYTAGSVSLEEHDFQGEHSIGVTWEADALPIIVGVTFKQTRLLEMMLMAGELTE
jgi:hypothetical protein